MILGMIIGAMMGFFWYSVFRRETISHLKRMNKIEKDAADFGRDQCNRVMSAGMYWKEKYEELTGKK